MSEERTFPQGILPVLPVDDIAKTADYYVDTLQFTEVFRQPGEDGVMLNAQLTFEGSTLMLNLNPEHAPLAGGGVYLWVRLYDKNIDEYCGALKHAGATIVDDIQDQFWGDRSFVIQDCNGFHIAFNQAIGS